MPRHAKPTALKVLAGNPGKRPLPTDEPHFSNADELPPEWLNECAKKLWLVYSEQLNANGMLNTTNREFLGAYCQLTAAFILEQESGEPPCLKKLQQMRLMAREFGFTPSSQASITAPAKAEVDEKDRLFN